MEKNILIGRIYKILPMKENLVDGKITKEEFETYITKQYIQFSGLDIKEPLKEEILLTLKGIKNLQNELTVKDIKSNILRLTNMINREV